MATQTSLIAQQLRYGELYAVAERSVYAPD